MKEKMPKDKKSNNFFDTLKISILYFFSQIPAFFKSSSPTKNKNVGQAIKFAIFSLSAGIIQVVSFAALELLFSLVGTKGQDYWAVCYLPSLVLSVVWNFTLNRKFTFQSASNVPIAMLKVAAFYLVFTPVSLLLGNVADKAGWNDFLIQALVMASNLILEFLYQKFFVFRDKQKKPLPENTNENTEVSAEYSE